MSCLFNSKEGKSLLWIDKFVFVLDLAKDESENVEFNLGNGSKETKRSMAVQCFDFFLGDLI